MTRSDVPEPAPPAPPVKKDKTPFVRQPHLTHKPLGKNQALADLKVFLEATRKPIRRKPNYKKGRTK